MNEFVLNLALHDKRQRSNAHDRFPLLRTKRQIFKSQEEWMLSTQRRTIHLCLTESSDPKLSAQLHHHISHLAANEVVAEWRSEAEETTNQAKSINSSVDSSKWIYWPLTPLWLR